MLAKRNEHLKMMLSYVPTGCLVDSRWFTSRNIAHETFRSYVNQGWLERVERGVFRRPVPKNVLSDPIDWKACLLSLQRIMGYQAHIGGRTALYHYDYLSRRFGDLGKEPTVCVYGNNLPNWLAKLPLNATVKTRSTSLFADPLLGLKQPDKEYPDTMPWDWNFNVSLEERAAMEVMDDLHGQEDFKRLGGKFKDLQAMRPELLSQLLHSCKKVKVKRLFFVFADLHQHQWRKDLDAKDYDLGSGDRAMVKGGKMHPAYRIMVPKEFIPS